MGRDAQLQGHEPAGAARLRPHRLERPGRPAPDGHLHGDRHRQGPRPHRQQREVSAVRERHGPAAARPGGQALPARELTWPPSLRSSTSPTSRTSSRTTSTTGPFTIQRGSEAAYGVYLTEVEQKTISTAVALYRGSAAPGLWTLGTTRIEGCRTDIPGTTCDPRTGDLYLATDDGAGVPFADSDQLG